jgi:hypothetical protein
LGSSLDVGHAALEIGLSLAQSLAVKYLENWIVKALSSPVAEEVGDEAEDIGEELA